MALWQAYHDKGPGFEIIAFPCNQFGAQVCTSQSHRFTHHGAGARRQRHHCCWLVTPLVCADVSQEFAAGYGVQFKMMDKVWPVWWLLDV